MIPVRLLHLLSIADSPERRSKNYISLGSGLYSGRWGFAANINHLSKKLPYCKICLIKAITNTIASIDTVCPYCHQWDFLSSNESMTSIPPEIEHITNHNDSCKQFVIQKPTLLNYIYILEQCYPRWLLRY